MGKQANIMGYDITQMSPMTKVIYLFGVLGLFVVVFYVLVNTLFKKPVNFQEKRRQELLQRRQKKNK
jgi:hypothetical protein